MWDIVRLHNIIYIYINSRTIYVILLWFLPLYTTNGNKLLSKIVPVLMKSGFYRSELVNLCIEISCLSFFLWFLLRLLLLSSSSTYLAYTATNFLLCFFVFFCRSHHCTLISLPKQQWECDIIGMNVSFCLWFFQLHRWAGAAAEDLELLLSRYQRLDLCGR